jgi:hypothetical protein
MVTTIPGDGDGVWAVACTEDSVSVKGLGDGEGEGIVRVNSRCQRGRRANIASLCQPAHKPAANTRSKMVADTNRFLSKLCEATESDLILLLAVAGDE